MYFSFTQNYLKERFYETFKWVIPFKGQAKKLHIGKQLQIFLWPK